MIPVYLGLGGNLGNPQNTIILAIKSFSNHPLMRLISISSYYRSAPINATGDEYINCVVKIGWQSDEIQLLETCLNIEKEFGRERSFKNAPRTLDIDILLFSQRQIEKNNLSIPHPELTNRAFVLLPLIELDPEINIPGKGKAKNFLHQVSNQIITRC